MKPKFKIIRKAGYRYSLKKIEEFDSEDLENLINGRCKGELDSVCIHDFVRKTIKQSKRDLVERILTIHQMSETRHGFEKLLLEMKNKYAE